MRERASPSRYSAPFLALGITLLKVVRYSSRQEGCGSLKTTRQGAGFAATALAIADARPVLMTPGELYRPI